MSENATAFEGFIAELHGAGYATDLGQITAAQHLLLLAAAGAWPGAAERLGTLLTPIFAQSEAQQADVMARVARWHTRLLLPERIEAPVPPAQSLRAPALAALQDRPAEKVSATWLGFRRWVVQGFLAALLGLAALSWWFAGPPGPALIPLRTLALPPPASAPPVIAPGMGWRLLNGTAQSGPGATSAFNAGGGSPPFIWDVMMPVLLGALPVGVGGALWYRDYRQARRWHRLAGGSPRDIAELSVMVPEIPLFEDLASELAGRDLAQPRRIAGNELDIERSVEATSRAAGLGTLVLRERSASPAYVFVVEEAGRHDHLARLADRLGDRLADAGVLAERYHMSSPRLVRDADGRTGTLEEVARRHPDHRLLLVGPGDVLTDSRGRALDPALRADTPWADRGFLVAGRIDSLTVRLLTEEGFAVAPATPAGLGELGRYIASAPREAGEVLATLPGTEPNQPAREDLLAALADRLSAGYVALAAGDPEEARKAARAALDLAQITGDAHQQPRVMLLQGAIAEYSGDLDRAATWARDAAAILIKVRHVHNGRQQPLSNTAAQTYAEAVFLASRWLRLDGRFKDAEAWLRSASKQLVAAGGSLAVAQVAAESALVWEARGDWRKAERSLRNSATLARLEPAHAVWLTSRRAQVLQRAAQWNKAIDAAQDAVLRAERLKLTEILAPALFSAVNIGLQAGSRGEGLANLAALRLEILLLEPSLPDPVKVQAAATLGDFHLARKEPEEAVKAFQTALHFVPATDLARTLALTRGLAHAEDVAGNQLGALATLVSALERVDPQTPSLEAARLNIACSELLTRPGSEIENRPAGATYLRKALTDLERLPPATRAREGFDAEELARGWLQLCELQQEISEATPTEAPNPLREYLNKALEWVGQIENPQEKEKYVTQANVLVTRHENSGKKHEPKDPTSS